MTPGQAWAYIGVTLGAVASVAANVAHSWIAPPHAHAGWTPGVGPVIAAGFWPLALMIALEVLVRSSWSTGPISVTVRYGGVGLVAAVAAIVSYQHLSGLLRHYHESGTASTIGPLSIDGLMLVCTAALLSASADAVPATAPSVGVEPSQDRASPVSATAAQPAKRSAATSANPPAKRSAKPAVADPPRTAPALRVADGGGPVADGGSGVAGLPEDEQLAYAIRHLAARQDWNVPRWMAETGWSEGTARRRLKAANEAATDGATDNGSQHREALA